MRRSVETPLMLTRDRARERLLEEVGHRWTPGMRLPPVKQLAQMLGTGHTNMFRAVKQLVDEGVLLARPRLGTFVHPDYAARHHDAKPTGASADALAKKVVHIFHAPHDGFVMPAISLLQQGMTRAGARVNIFHTQADREAAQITAARHCHAMVLCNPSLQVEAAEPPATMLVLSTAQSWRPLRETGYDLVTVDSQHGGFLAGCHLRAIGAIQVCFVGVGTGGAHPVYDSLSRARLEACCNGFRGAVAPEHQLMVPLYFMADGARAFLKYQAMRHRPDAVFCASDDLAIGFAMQAVKSGLTPGYDFQLVGFDGQLRGRHLASGALTTVDVPILEMARVGLNLLRQRLATPERPVQNIQIGCSLYRGQTTRTLVADATI